MPNSRRGRRQQPYRPLRMERLHGMPRAVSRRGSEYSVQHVAGNEKSYVCPGCHHPVAPFTPHLVVFPTDAPFGVDLGVQARRHWHPNCWKSV